MTELMQVTEYILRYELLIAGLLREAQGARCPISGCTNPFWPPLRCFVYLQLPDAAPNSASAAVHVDTIGTFL